MINEDWIGVIPAAGKGLRLNLPYPKELYPIIRDNRYKPVSQFVLDNMLACGIQDIIFVINETKHQLIGYFGNGHRFGCNISYVVQEVNENISSSTSPGLATALDSAYHLIRGKTVFFGMADTIMQPKEVFTQGLNGFAPDDDIALCLFPTNQPEKFGMVHTDSNNRVIEIVDKPTSTNLSLMWGCVIWRPTFTQYLHKAININSNVDFASIMNEAIKDGLKIKGIPIEDANYIDLGTYDEIMELDLRYRESN